MSDSTEIPVMTIARTWLERMPMWWLTPVPKRLVTRIPRVAPVERSLLLTSM